MTLRKLSLPELETLYKREIKAAFPPAERRPLSAMVRMTQAGAYHPYVWQEGEDWLGYALLWSREPGGYLLLDYLGITPARRNRGLGAELLARLGATFSDGRGIFGEAEAPDGGAADDLRLRRLDFYRRCGFVRLPYDTRLFGVHYQTLLLGGDEADWRGVMAVHQDLYRGSMPAFIYHRMVKIPYGGEKEGLL